MYILYVAYYPQEFVKTCIKTFFELSQYLNRLNVFKFDRALFCSSKRKPRSAQISVMAYPSHYLHKGPEFVGVCEDTDLS